MSLAKTLMIQGTASNVGKSVMAAAVCRILKRRGYRVAPYKAQNMSNNSFVTADGGEIGRAQAVQAEACGIPPSVLHNPVLLKPDTDQKAQIVALGKPFGKIKTIANAAYQRTFAPIAQSALQELRRQYDVVVIEGAGSPAEMNLRKRDIVNMSVAKSVNSPVILVGDIDWGGIFAQLVGTYELLDKSERKLVKAFLINKFRGDKKILTPGLRWIEQRTKKKVLGVIPFLSDMDIAEEDSIVSGDSNGALAGLRGNVALDRISGKARDIRNIAVSADKVLIDVMWLPRISNFTDFDALKKNPGVFVRFLHQPDRRTVPDLIIIPGTKSTIADLNYLKKSGLADYVLRSAAAGTVIMGICGGYQMLGEKILDPDHAESSESSCRGLGLVPVISKFRKEKTTKQVYGIHIESGIKVSGYEIHMGQTKNSKGLKPLFEVREKSGGSGQLFFDGAVAEAVPGKNKHPVFGTYLHGVFDNPEFLDYFLNDIRGKRGLKPIAGKARTAISGSAIDCLADHVQKNIDMRFLETLIR